MNYNLADKAELKAAKNKLYYHSLKGDRVRITKVVKGRSLAQNNYLHLLLGAFGMHFGYTIEEAKHIYKGVNRELFIYQKKGRTFIRSSADLTSEEMAKSIDRFMVKSAEAGYELPPATNQEWLLQIENEIERSRRYL